MPLYEYQCDDCEHRFELIRKFSDEPVKTCPSCGGHVQKLASSPAIQFKGTGWYVTDYARKPEAGASEEQKTDPKDSKTSDKSKAKDSKSKSDSSSSKKTTSSSTS